MAYDVAFPTEHTGAIVTGLDLNTPPDAATRARLNDLFLERGVLVIRGQRLAPQALLEAAELFGEVFAQHNTRFSLPECPRIHYLSNQDSFPDGRRYIPGEGWHTDHSNDVKPPKATILYALKIPSSGGDTQYVNMTDAYDALPYATRHRLDGLRAIHVYQSSHSARQLMALPGAAKERVPNAVLHPIVRTHPETARRAIFINPIRIEGIVGLDHREALPLLDQLLAHATEPRFEYRHKWRAGDMVMWDNRRLLHKANGDYDMNEVRYLYRLMLSGDQPC